MKKVELLSPAGDFESLKAAVNYGADAVYIGGTLYSARAFAKNFNNEELIEAVKYCHLRGVKVYVTMNTLLTENEIENAFKQVKFYYDNNVDALIIQDLGLFYLIKERLPDFELHASTQMHIHNVKGVENAKKLGFSKVVVARESSLDLIKEFCKQDIQIECFVHGAICVSYSGQCLLSSVTKNRSANRGACAQCCRLKYELFDVTENKKIKTDTDFLLSPKDMFLLEDIPDLIKAGVSSFKIEGRLKSPTYVGLVTKVYREAIDAYYEDKHFTLNKKTINNLLSVFNRDFSNTYLLNNNSDLFNNSHPNHMGIEIGEVIKATPKKCFIKLIDEVNQFDGIRIINSNNEYGKILNTITVNGKFVNHANKYEIIEIETTEQVNTGDKVVKTLDYKLEKDIANYALKKKPISLDITLKENTKVVIKAKIDADVFTKEFAYIPEIALKAPISKENIIKQFSKLNESPFIIKDFNIELGNVFVPISKLNELRRDFFNEFEEFILNRFIRKTQNKPNLGTFVINDICEPLILNRSEIEIKNAIKEVNPVINYDGIYNSSDLVCEFGGLLNNNPHKIAYYTLNCSNSYSYELLLRLGFEKIILSSELTQNNIDLLIDSFRERHNILIRPYVFAYGRRGLMYLRRNPIEKYYIKGHNYELIDHNNSFSVVINDKYTELREKEPYLNEKIDNNENMFIIVDDFLDLKFIKEYFHLNV